jgi:hypothetical protein
METVRPDDSGHGIISCSGDPGNGTSGPIRVFGLMDHVVYLTQVAQFMVVSLDSVDEIRTTRACSL